MYLLFAIVAIVGGKVLKIGEVLDEEPKRAGTGPPFGKPRQERLREAL